MSQIKAVRSLLSQLHTSPEDDEASAVLADWCEEHGFDRAALAFRDSSSMTKTSERAKAVFALQLLFGDHASAYHLTGRYNMILGCPRIEVDPSETEEVRVETYAPMLIRHLVIAESVRPCFSIQEVRVARNPLIANSEPVVGDIFSPEYPDLIDFAIRPGEIVRILVENITHRPTFFFGSLLGIDLEPSLRAPLPYPPLAPP